MTRRQAHCFRLFFLLFIFTFVFSICSSVVADSSTTEKNAQNTKAAGDRDSDAVIDTVEGDIPLDNQPSDSEHVTGEGKPAPWIGKVDEAFGKYVVGYLDKFLFYDFGTKERFGTSIPFILAWLFFGAVFFTLRMGFINIRAFWHAIRLTKGDFDKPGETGEVSHFQALASALSATVGLGNIAGVAIAVGTGGPGAIFWLILAGLLGMSSKFTECTLGQMYRKVDRDGTVSGGAMHYLRDGLAELGLSKLGTVLAVLFTLLCIGASFGGGCVFQVSQSRNLLAEQFTGLQEFPWIYGIIASILTGVVIIGGIRRIASVADKIVPFMCGLYVLGSFTVLAIHYDKILPAFELIFQSAFSNEALYGGFIGVMVIGIRRAAFSNEAGVGSAPIAHAAARTEEPVSEGIVALLEPFIDTVVVCTMTGLVMVISGAYCNPEYKEFVTGDKGAALTSAAFAETIPWFPMVLTVIVVLFAYSTMISWSYYGERCWSQLFGRRTSIVYKLIFISFIMLGSIVGESKLLAFADLMLFSMALPNIFGAILLSGKVKRHLDDYWRRYKSGELDPNKT